MRATALNLPAIAAATAAFSVGACVENQPYRLAKIDDAHYSEQLPYEEDSEAGEGRRYHLSFVEFDEKGDFWDRRQLGRAAEAIAKHPHRAMLLVIFIHGWHHNANNRTPPGDVETFRCLLSQLAVSEATENVRVHGVYLGWRGRLLDGNLDYLTFWGRKAAATRVAGTPVTETIFELIRQARTCHAGAARCVLVGHSFGALVLEKAMAQAMTGAILSQAASHRFAAPADLVLLVNSAAESLYAKEMRDMFERIEPRGDVDPHHPLMISITSESDSATGFWFRVGTSFPNVFAHRQYHWGHRYDHASDEVDQNEYLTTTAGHNARLFSHRIAHIAPPPDAPSPELMRMRAKRTSTCSLAENAAFEQNLRYPRPDFAFATPALADEKKFDWWQLVEEGRDPTTPYWIIQVPDKIIHGHGPIFTPAGRALMAALFRIASPPGTTAPRQIRLSDNKASSAPVTSQ
jgi:hypothetical protein